MIDWLISDGNTIFRIVVSTFLIFVLLIIWVRVAGLRSFAKMSVIDFASTIAIGSILATTILSKSTSIMGGGIAVAAILLFQAIFSKLTLRSEPFDTLVSNKPLLLMRGSEILHDNLRSTNLSEGDLMAKLREANIIQLSEVKAVIFETTGDVSVLHADNDKAIDDILLKDIRS